jgi:acyl phosphate:glycerol-3-phosphate acyltransferase
MALVVWIALTYLSGSLPWSVWLGKRFFNVDPRDQVDANPGAANAFRSAGWRLGIVVLLLDFVKAFIPVLIASRGIGFTDAQLFAIALMPTLGHAFSVFLGFRGGRAIVVMFGVWAGLTLYHIPLVMGATAIATVFILRNDERRTLLIPVVLIVYLIVRGWEGWMIVLAVAQLLVFVVKMVAPYLGLSMKVNR